MNKIEFIAKIRFIAWIAYQLAARQPYNIKPNKDQWESLLDGVKFALENPDMTPEENHENWMKEKRSQGWIYGPKKDFDKKTHPDLVPYDELTEIEKLKDTMDKVIQKEALELWDKLQSLPEDLRRPFL